MKSLGHGRVSERRRNAGHRHPEPDARILLCKERPKSSRSAVADHESPQPLSVLLDATTVESGPTSGSTPMEEKLAPPSIQPFLAYAHQDADHFHHQLRIHLCPSDNGQTIFFRSSAVGSRFIGAHGLSHFSKCTSRRLGISSLMSLMSVMFLPVLGS